MKQKKILVDINHPAHVHLFRHFIREMELAGYAVLVAAKHTPAIVTLLNRYAIPFTSTGRKRDGMLWKYIVEGFHVLQLVWLVITKRIDYGIGVSMVLPVVSTLTGMKSFCLDDDDVAVTPLFGKFVAQADVIVTPSALAYEHRGPHHVCHASFHELAYLHPNRFVPDPAILDEIGIAPGAPFFVLRFNVFKAHHDADAQGLTTEQKRALVSLLRPHGTIFITTERDIDPEFKPYQLPVSPEKIHALLYYATLFVGDSQTMTSEAALLGTPAVKLNSFAGRLSIPNELEQRYALCYSFRPGEFDRLLGCIKSLLAIPDPKAEWRRRRTVLLSEKIDLTSFLVDLVSNYPERAHSAEKPIVHYSPS